jgi:hypothetical protein
VYAMNILLFDNFPGQYGWSSKTLISITWKHLEFQFWSYPYVSRQNLVEDKEFPCNEWLFHWCVEDLVMLVGELIVLSSAMPRLVLFFKQLWKEHFARTAFLWKI